METLGNKQAACLSLSLHPAVSCFWVNFILAAVELTCRSPGRSLPQPPAPSGTRWVGTGGCSAESSCYEDLHWRLWSRWLPEETQANQTREQVRCGLYELRDTSPLLISHGFFTVVKIFHKLNQINGTFKSCSMWFLQTWSNMWPAVEPLVKSEQSDIHVSKFLSEALPANQSENFYDFCLTS